jgi:hypothetical protein
MIDAKLTHKPNETPILFINFRDKEFIGYWDKVPYKFASKESKWLPFWLAFHFSKSLVDEEMNSRKLPTDHSSRESFVAKCIGNKPTEQGHKDDPLGIEILNKNMAEKEKEPKEAPKKMGRPKKKAVTEPSSEVHSEEDSFEGK